QEIVGLGEMMNFPGVIFGDPVVEEKLQHARQLGMVIDGHAPGLSADALCAYVSAGIDSDHECTSWREAKEKLDLGMYLYMRQGTSEKNLRELIPAVTPENLHRCCLVSDDRDPLDLIEKGHMNHSLQEAVKGGLDPVDAISMATINPARRFRLDSVGAIAPGYFADIVLLRDLDGFQAEAVYYRGQLVAREGRMTKEPASRVQDAGVRKSVVLGGDLDLSIEATGGKVRVIGIIPGQIVTEELIVEPRVIDGLAVADPQRDICKLAVIERHHGTGNVGLGFVKGLGLERGALASTVAHDSHNIVVAGVDDESMLRAVEAIRECGGGLCVALGQEVKALLPLPIAGLMSDRQVNDVARDLAQTKSAASALGAHCGNPFMILSFLALPVIPELKLTDKGLVNVKSFSTVPLFFH
ncbi:MAG: adenine deaminase, partial [Thermodesulfobacteria bacterium]|nr:adenine deaminase [Thermodesulfobacteriota bacterium]